MDFAALDACCALPTPEEQAQKEEETLLKLRDFVVANGGSWEEGWDCRMRFRLTARRNGKMGRTTDNYYTSPCGQTFRNYRQVAEFLGLSVDAAVRGKPGPKAAKRPAAPAPTLCASAGVSGASDASCGTRERSGSPCPQQQQQQQQPQQHAGAPPSSAISSGSGASSGSPAGDDCALSAAPPAKKARTKAAIVARRASAQAFADVAPALAPLPLG